MPNVRYIAPDTFSAGLIIVGQHEGEVSSISATLEKKIEFVLNRPGSLGFSFDIKSSDGATTCGARVYRNGIAVGVLKETAETTYQAQTDIVAGWSKGDTCELWLGRTAGAANLVHARRFKLRSALPSELCEQI